jgi:hypothetical protein
MSTKIEVTVRAWDCDSTPAKAVTRVAAYLPSNYSVDRAWVMGAGDVLVMVEGEDSGGWTAEGYVIPRLLSGLYAAKIINEEAT